MFSMAFLVANILTQFVTFWASVLNANAGTSEYTKDDQLVEEVWKALEFRRIESVSRSLLCMGCWCMCVYKRDSSRVQ
jgi:hypothetical protein